MAPVFVAVGPQILNTKRVFAELKSHECNTKCVDCESTNHITWASVNMGLFLCQECAGKHRGLGVHLSFVRSVTLDSWNFDQLSLMMAGGRIKALPSSIKKRLN